ncbi:hypothetical protein [Streptomyces sp. NRRL F-5755]|uniref:hypothetical protein n=1 Tax=Streptomyces sp. NRRL F-5755 TaxID=1519475 RepID=UPI00099D2018|nr:hypothetical protein [Streptomyces sp. NRRL F-5755]
MAHSVTDPRDAGRATTVPGTPVPHPLDPLMAEEVTAARVVLSDLEKAASVPSSSSPREES